MVEAQSALDWALNGKDGSNAPVIDGGGARTAYQHGQLMAGYSPVFNTAPPYLAGLYMPYQLTLSHVLLLPLLGASVAAVGTMVGLGGGFIMVPILLVLFSDASPATVTSISLTVVFLNAASATVSNVRQRRIDYRTAALLVAGAVPAAVAGSAMAQRVSRGNFEVLFGSVLLIGAAYILWRSIKIGPSEQDVEHNPNRRIQERLGSVHLFYVNGLLALIISPMAGFVSSFFGIGGGIIHVPALSFILKVPLRVASATALLVLVATSVTAVSTLYVSGAVHEGWRRAGLLGLGALIGAQVGVYLGGRIHRRGILIIMSAAMVIVGARLVLS